MRSVYVPMTLFLGLLLLTGCQSGAGPLPLGTFINQSDSNQVLQLILDPSQTTNVLLRISIETGASRYFGKSVGRFVLKTDHGTAGGKFLWAKSPGDGSLREVLFFADDGKTWEMRVLQPDASLSDSTGVIWQRQS